MTIRGPLLPAVDHCHRDSSVQAIAAGSGWHQAPSVAASEPRRLASTVTVTDSGTSDTASVHHGCQAQTFYPKTVPTRADELQVARRCRRAT